MIMRSTDAHVLATGYEFGLASFRLVSEVPATHPNGPGGFLAQNDIRVLVQNDFGVLCGDVEVDCN